jgi:hypothetical protein
MLRKSLIVSLCLMLSVSSALAAEPSRSPELAAFSAQIGPPDRFAPASPVALHPGKPAGVQGAQVRRYYGAIAVGALALIAIGGYAISADSYHIPGSPTATAATSTQP